MFDLTGKAAAASSRVLQAGNNAIADQSVCAGTAAVRYKETEETSLEGGILWGRKYL